MKKKDIYNKLRVKTQKIVVEGRRLVSMGEFPNADSCSEKCASCLAVTARGLVDQKDYGNGFSSGEDVCMLEARSILAAELKMEIC